MSTFASSRANAASTVASSRANAASTVVVRAEAGWPESTMDIEPPALAGFVLSSFSPLVAEVAERCLRRAYGEPPADPALAPRTAIVLVTELGDLSSAVTVARAVDTGARVGPLQFFQSVPNAVAGYIAARWGLAGPVLCLSSSDDDGMAAADLLIEDGDADAALVLRVDQASTTGGRDHAVALLVSRTLEGEVG
jgi:hypothetical protein